MRSVALFAFVFAIGCVDSAPTNNIDIDQGGNMPDMSTDAGGLGFETFEALGETATVRSVSSGGLRSYALSTTASVRGQTIAERTVSEDLGSPRVRSNSLVFDAMFALAVAEAAENSVESITDGAFNDGEGVTCSCFETGEDWNYVWTRDIGYAVDLGLAWIDPSRVRRSLEFKVSAANTPPNDLQIVQDTGTGGSWPVSTDRVVWALGAQTLLNHLQGQERADFAALCYAALAKTIRVDREAVFDADHGLYRGETSFLDWREQTYPLWMRAEFGALASSFSLSTNLAHLSALEFASALAEDAGDSQVSGEFSGWAQALRQAVAGQFWSNEDQMPVSYIMADFVASTPRRFDALAVARAAQMGIVFPTSGLKNYPHSELGPPAIYPQLPNVPIYHNRALWPFVTAYVMLAASREGAALISDHAFESLLRGAAIYLSNMENFEYTTQSAWFDDGDLSGPVVNSRRQLWSVAGYIGAVVRGLFGLRVRAEGLSVSPVVGPKARRWLGATPVLQGLSIGGHRLEVRLLFGTEDSQGWRAGKITLDGVEVLSPILIDSLQEQSVIEVSMVAMDTPGPSPVVLTETASEEVNLTVKSDPAGVEVAVDSSGVTLYRDGQIVATDVSDRWVDTTVRTGYSPCYTATISKSNPAEAQCWWGPEFERRVVMVGADALTVNAGYWGESGGRRHWVDWGGPDEVLRSPLLVAKHTGAHWIQWEYSNGAGPQNTGISASVKRMTAVSSDGRTLAEHMIVFPHTASWTDWQDSQVLKVELTAGQTFSVVLEDFQNMSYLDHFNTYTGGAGGGIEPYSRVNLVGLKVLVKDGVHDAAVGALVPLSGSNDLDAFPASQRLTPGVQAAAGDAFAMDWDDEYLYVALRSAVLADGYKPFMIYLEASEGAWQPAAASQGLEYSGLRPNLPFTPTSAVSLRGFSDDGSADGPWNGVWLLGAQGWQRQQRMWTEDWWYDEANATLSVRIPRAGLGSVIRWSSHVVNAVPGQEWKDTVPASHTPWVEGSGYYEIDLSGTHDVGSWVIR